MNKQHKKEVKKLFDIERDLTNLIADTENLDLQTKFTEWLVQRNVCNEDFIKIIEGFKTTNNE